MGKIITGVGSRETPKYYYDFIVTIARNLSERGFTLRSGAADGADTAFETGWDQSPNGFKQIFIPWDGFNGRRASEKVKEGSFIQAGVGPKALELAAQYHPGWESFKHKRGVTALHARNGYQVLGRKLDIPSDALICYTRNGKGEGGTGQALRIATAYNIPIFDLGCYNEGEQLHRFYDNFCEKHFKK